MVNSMVDQEKKQKRWVWVPCRTKLYKPAYILEEEGSRIRVQSDVEEIFGATDVFRMNPGKFDRADDLASLSHLNEPSVLHNLEGRYNDSLIYTYSGLFLIALNPYHSLNIYNDEIKKQAMAEKAREGSPHIFGIANEAYQLMLANRENQSILITGESGAGKTENTKRVIEFLSYAAGNTDEMEDGFNINRALVSANPILEAFGNAKTIKNDNSSRFGKFIQIKFREGRICGAKIEKYLLEKSRVTSASSEERTFHIFYYLLSGASDSLRETLRLSKNPSDYNCIKNTRTKIAGVDDRAEFEKLNEAFQAIGIADPLPFYRIISVIMHLSNVNFTSRDEQCSVDCTPSYNPLSTACGLLGVQYSEFLEAILKPVMKAGNEYIVQYRSAPQALTVVDGLMKMLYEVLFDTLIAAINRKLDTTCDSYIGILDIAGFEIFKNNSFEQLCINYTNEKLQQYFNHHMFILEQEIYRNEGIEWDFIDFGLDLEPTIRTIEYSNPIGVFSYLDEECVMPCASDKTLLEKIRTIKAVESVAFTNSFKIKHYAGQVEYEVQNWLRKNKDTESEMLLGIIKEGVKETLNIERLGRSAGYKIVKKGIFKTVAQSHKESLLWLMETLRSTQPHFVRCILPNMTKSSSLFDKQLILNQLRCNGVLEGIRISRLGYPSRMAFGDFVSRYGMLVPSTQQDREEALPRTRAQEIVGSLVLNNHQYKMGRTMLFFRQGVLADLEEMRDKKIQGIACAIQHLLRGKISLKKLTLEADRLKAVERLQKDGRHCLELLRWKWWALFLKIQPLLDVKKAENDRQKHEEEMNALNKMLEGLRQTLKEKERDIDMLRLDSEEMKRDLSQRDREATDREELINSLREQTAQIQGIRSEIQSKEAQLGLLNGQLREARDREAEHLKENRRLGGAIGDVEKKLKSKEQELQSFIKQDYDNVLKMKDAEIKQLSDKLASATKNNTALTTELKSSKELAQKKSEQCVTLQNQCTQKDAEIFELQKGLSEAAVAATAQILENEKLVSKLRAELADAQLESDNLTTRIVQLECDIEMAKDTNNSLLQQLEYQKTRNTGLEASLNSLRALKTPEKKAEPVPEQPAADTLMLNKTINTLKAKLAREQSINSKLTEEKNELYNENLRLMQSKLDDLFHTESEFNAAKAAMQADIRRLENEVASLRKELSQNISDYSEDSGFEKVSQLLEEERNQRKALDIKLIGLENANVKLQNKISTLNGELACLQDATRENQNLASLSKGLQASKGELDHLRRSLNSISDTFMGTFFKAMEAKNIHCYELTEKMASLSEDRRLTAERLSAVTKQYEGLSSRISGLQKEHSHLNNEFEAATVANKVLITSNRELTAHLAKLETAYEERDLKINEIKIKYVTIHRELEAKKAELAEQVRLLKDRVLSTGSKDSHEESLKSLKQSYCSRIEKLTSELEQLRTTNEELRSKIHKHETDSSELRKFVETVGPIDFSEHRWVDAEDFIREKLVSSLIVDKDALRAAEWKNVVASKCARCTEVKQDIPADSSLSAEVNRLTGEYNLVSLRLKQAERANEENKRIIEAMQSCVAVIRKGKQVRE